MGLESEKKKIQTGFGKSFEMISAGTNKVVKSSQFGTCQCQFKSHQAGKGTMKLIHKV